MWEIRFFRGFAKIACIFCGLISERFPLPLDIYGILADDIVVRDYAQSLGLGLRDDHPVKWVSMVGREIIQGVCVQKAERQNLRSSKWFPSVGRPRVSRSAIYAQRASGHPINRRHTITKESEAAKKQVIKCLRPVASHRDAECWNTDANPTVTFLEV